MKPLNYSGYEKVMLLIEQGLTLNDIKNHPDSIEFLSYHKQVKLWLLKKIIENSPEKDAIIASFYKDTHK